MITGGIGHDRDPGLGKACGDALKYLFSHLAKGIGMTDTHTPLQTGGAGAFGDPLQLFNTLQARLVQVDVDLNTMPFGNPEDHLQLTFGITVKGGRIDAADHLGAVANGRFQYVSGTRAGHHPGLRKGYQLNVDDTAPFLPCLHHRMQVAQAGGGIDIDMAAHGYGAERHRLGDQGVGALDD
ncbi:hypothetical protein D3C79_525240 [compost metagenome]